MPHGYYVMASRAAGAYRLPLVGPFKRMTAAIKMLDPVVEAVHRTRPDLHDCTISPAAYNSGNRPLPRGRLDLSEAVDQRWIRWCMGERWDDE